MDFLRNNPNLVIGNVISFVAAVFMAISCIARERKRVFVYQAINCFILAIASYFFGSFAGITTLAICGVRNLIIAFDRYSKPVMVITLIAAAIAGLWANNRGLLGLLPVLATVEYTVCCHYIRDENATRWSILVNEVIWIVYAVLIMDISTSISEFSVVVVDIFSIFRHRKKNLV